MAWRFFFGLFSLQRKYQLPDQSAASFLLNTHFFALFWTSELMSRETFGSDLAQDNTTQGLEYPGYTSAGKEDKLMYQSPLNRPARIFLWSETY